MQMLSNQHIDHPHIFDIPATRQQLTIGLIQKLVNSTFTKVGLVIEEIDYLLSKAASAFNSHSLATVNKAMRLQT